MGGRLKWVNFFSPAAGTSFTFFSETFYHHGIQRAWITQLESESESKLDPEKSSALSWWRSWESELESLLSNRERWERKSEWIRLESATRFGYFYHLVMFLVTFFHQKCSQNPYFFLACGGLGGRLKWVFGFYLDPLGGRLKWVVDLRMIPENWSSVSRTQRGKN